MVIPCRAEYIGLCRLVAGVVGARESLDEEDIADLKLVVTEACTCFLWGPDGASFADSDEQRPQGPAALRIEFNVMPEAWEITISDPQNRHQIPGVSKCAGGSGGGLGLTIIQALADTVEHTLSETEGSVIRLVKKLSGERPASA